MSMDTNKLRQALLRSTPETTITDYGVEFPDGTIDWGTGLYDFANHDSRVDFLRNWHDQMTRLHVSEKRSPRFVQREVTIAIGKTRPMGRSNPEAVEG